MTTLLAHCKFAPDAFALPDNSRIDVTPEGLFFPSWTTKYLEWTLWRPKLVPGQDDMEGIHLRRREVDGPIA